jgi:hypothetical protein
MAEIELQRKNRSPFGWILVVLILAAGVWAVAEIVGPDEAAIDDAEMGAEVAPPLTEPAPAAGDAAPGEAPATSASIDQFLTEARGFAAADMGRQHETTATALQHLVPALIAIAPPDAGTSMDTELRELRQAATRIGETPWSADTHANEVREAFIAAADLMRRTTDGIADAPAEVSDQVDSVRQAAEALAADRPLLEQRDAVARFFDSAAAAVAAMRASAPMAG